MEVLEFTLMLGTNQPEKMAQFYGKILGLPRIQNFSDPVFRAHGGNIRILNHSEIKGTNVEQARFQINLFVANALTEFKRLKTQQVPVVREPQKEEWGGIVATLEDPDGNYVQLLEAPSS